MNRMEVGPVTCQSDKDRTRIAAVVTTPDFNQELWFSLPVQMRADTSANPFLAATLVPAMKLGLPLHVRGTVSGRLLQSVATIQAIFNKWYPELAIVPVTADQIAENLPPATQAAAFFSGGMDSFHTVLKNEEQIDHLVFVHGFDIPLSNLALRKAVVERIRDAAHGLGISLLEIETNIREFGDRDLSWGLHYFGPALASVGLLLENGVGRMFIPSSESFAHLEPCPSHPLVDPLWSTERVEIIHDGAEASRNEKAACIADSEIAMESLRVCWENPGNAYNCGQCEKCLRTMINLESVGALQRCATFRHALDPAAVRNMDIGLDLVLYHVEENLRVLEASGRNHAVVEALRASISDYKVSRLEAGFRNNDSDPSLQMLFSRLVTGRKERAFKAIWQTNPGWLVKEVVKETVKRFVGRKVQ